VGGGAAPSANKIRSKEKEISNQKKGSLAAKRREISFQRKKRDGGRLFKKRPKEGLEKKKAREKGQFISRREQTKGECAPDRFLIECERTS